jgi:flagellar motor protein MotB
MRAALHQLLFMALLAAAGCVQNPYAMQSQMSNLQQQQTAVAQQNQQLESRAGTLDQDNQELETLLAQSRQQNKLLQDQLVAMRDQLTSTTQQLGQVRTEKSSVEQKAQASLASTPRRAGASISANSSLGRDLPVFNLPGVEVRQDGDVVRVELPAEKMFDASAARLRMESTPMIDQVAAELERTYPGHFIGIEGHTDTDPPASTQWLSNHQLSLARAQAVFEYLVARTRLRPNSLFVVGHGGNHPVVSNATTAGKLRNRRVELAIYPDRIGP